MPTIDKSKLGGFTLIELLVVISIISLLSSIILSSTSSIKNKANIAAALKYASHNHKALGAYSYLDLNFNEGSGVTTFDGVSNISTGGATWVLDTPTGKGSSLSFNGTSNHIQGTIDGSVFTNPVSGPKDFTISAWFKHNGPTTWGSIFSNSVGTPNTPIMTMRNNTTQIGMMRVGDYDDGVFVDLGPNHYGKWIYAVVTYKKSTNTISVYAYLDGKLIQSSGPLYWTLNSTNSYYVGRHYIGGLYFNGYIKEVHVYGDALTLSDIQDKYLAESKIYLADNFTMNSINY